MECIPKPATRAPRSP